MSKTSPSTKAHEIDKLPIMGIKIQKQSIKYCFDHSLLNNFTSSTIRGLTEENTQMDIISPIWYFQPAIGD